MQINFTFENKEYQKIYDDIVKKDISNQKYLLFVIIRPIVENNQWEEFLNDEKTSIIIFLSQYIQGYKNDITEGNRDDLDNYLGMMWQVLKNPMKINKCVSQLTDEMNKIKNEHIKLKMGILINLLH